MTTGWVVDTADSQIPLAASRRGESSFTVTNPGPSDDSVVFDVVPGEGADRSWFTVDQPQRRVPGQNGTVVFVVGLTVPPGTAPGRYDFTGRVYSVNSAPEETARTSGRVTFDVPAAAVPPKRSWVPYAVAAVVLAVVVATIGYLLLKPDPSDETSTASPSTPPGTPAAPARTVFAEAIGAVGSGGDGASYFARSTTGDLWQFAADGGSGRWTNLEHPEAGPVTAGVGAVVLDGGARPQVYVLAGGDVWLGEGRGASWSWQNLGRPAGVSVAGPVGVGTENGATPSVYVRGGDGHLWQRRSTSARWGDLGAPGGSAVASAGSVVTIEGDRPRVFVLDTNGVLQLALYDGGWRWESQGPPPGTRVEALLGATVQDGRLPHAFVRAADGQVWVRRWNGSGWRWQAQGKPSAGATIGGPVGALPWAGDELLLFVQTGQNQVWLNCWDTGTQRWSWIDQKIPNPGRLAGNGGAATLTATDRVVLFARTSTGDLWFTRPFRAATTTPEWQRIPAP